MTHKINIIYYIWINANRDWRVIIEGQLFDMKISGILDVSNLYMMITCSDDELINDVKNLINNSLENRNNYYMEFFKENFYEYYGIKKLYDTAREEPDKYFIYLHSKGMFNWYNNNPNIRSKDEINLTRYTIYLWRDILDVYEKNPHIKKVGMFPATDGWMWMNFFWAKGEYLITCQNPIVTNQYRYYYESWLGSGHQTEYDSYGIYENSYKKYEAEEVINIMNRK